MVEVIVRIVNIRTAETIDQERLNDRMTCLSIGTKFAREIPTEVSAYWRDDSRKRGKGLSDDRNMPINVS